VTRTLSTAACPSSTAFRQRSIALGSLLLARGDLSIFATRPISLAILIAAGVLLAVFCAPAIRAQTVGKTAS
jgi:TctA family transporter